MGRATSHATNGDTGKGEGLRQIYAFLECSARAGGSRPLSSILALEERFICSCSKVLLSIPIPNFYDS